MARRYARARAESGPGHHGERKPEPVGVDSGARRQRPAVTARGRLLIAVPSP